MVGWDMRRRCQHCMKKIVEEPDGTWIGDKDGDPVCIPPRSIGSVPVPHQPMPEI
jgi:hypothetical protein